jgi:hypothetical protein
LGTFFKESRVVEEECVRPEKDEQRTVRDALIPSTKNRQANKIPDWFKPLEDSNHVEEDCTGGSVCSHVLSCGVACAGQDSYWAAGSSD